MTLRDRWNMVTLGRVSLVPPLGAAAVALFAVFLKGDISIGVGIAVGALLATINGVLLSRRVEVAADTGDVATALVVMQVGLFATFVLVGLSTLVLLRFSLAMTVASAVSFAVTQLGLLVSFYLTRGRRGDVTSEGFA